MTLNTECQKAGCIAKKFSLTVLYLTSHGYGIPEPVSFSATLSYIRSLPPDDQPEVFGLHENAAIAHAQHEAHTLFRAIAGVDQAAQGIADQFGAVSRGGRSEEEAAEKVASSILSALPNDVSILCYLFQL